MRYCNVLNCNSKHWCKGYCSLHYGRWYRWGDTQKIKRESHSMHKTPEYKAWSHMKERCTNESNKGYKNYGGRGIKVSERWLGSFKAFYKDMGKRPSKYHSLDRIDNNGNYEASNCRWATKNIQNINRRGRSNTGHIGVSKNKKGKYYSYISDGVKTKSLGIFDELEEAIIARSNAEKVIIERHTNL